MGTSKLIDLRDCENPEYQRIYREMEQIISEMHSRLGRILIRILNPDAPILPIWSRRWEWPWAVLNGDVHRGMRVLDGGCGGSPLLPYLAKREVECYGVDSGAQEAKQTWQDKILLACGVRYQSGFQDGRLPGFPPIVFRKEALESMSFGDAFFDRIFCISVMEHISVENQARAVKEMALVLRPGGLLVMTVDLPRGDPHASDSLVEASGLRLLGNLDYSVSRAVRHGYDYEVGGLILEKQARHKRR